MKMASYESGVASYANTIVRTYGRVYNTIQKEGDSVEISVNTNKEVKDIQIEITCNEITPDVEKIIAALRMMDKQLIGKLNGQIHIIPVSDIVYIESVDRKCFIYTEKACLEADFKLYELEAQLCVDNFFRISKSMLINLQEVKSIKAELNRRLLVTMRNGEQIITSRQYADELKKMLGVK